MLNTPNLDSTAEKRLNKPEYREKIWSELFNSEYRPDFDFSNFFKNIEKYINLSSFLSFNQRSLKFLNHNAHHEKREEDNNMEYYNYYISSNNLSSVLFYYNS